MQSTSASIFHVLFVSGVSLISFHSSQLLSWLFQDNAFLTCARSVLFINANKDRRCTGFHAIIQARKLWRRFCVYKVTSAMKSLLLATHLQTINQHPIVLKITRPKLFRYPMRRMYFDWISLNIVSKISRGGRNKTFILTHLKTWVQQIRFHTAVCSQCQDKWKEPFKRKTNKKLKY